MTREIERWERSDGDREAVLPEEVEVRAVQVPPEPRAARPVLQSGTREVEPSDDPVGGDRASGRSTVVGFRKRKPRAA